jgi:hypothetical protein
LLDAARDIARCGVDVAPSVMQVTAQSGNCLDYHDNITLEVANPNNFPISKQDMVREERDLILECSFENFGKYSVGTNSFSG